LVADKLGFDDLNKEATLANLDLLESQEEKINFRDFGILGTLI